MYGFTTNYIYRLRTADYGAYRLCWTYHTRACHCGCNTIVEDSVSCRLNLDGTVSYCNVLLYSLLDNVKVKVWEI